MSSLTNRPIVLINPLYRQDWEYVEDNPAAIFPLGILSIATVLNEAGYRAKIIDACTNPNYLNEIEEAAKDSPLFFGISAMTAQVHSALRIINFIRQKCNGRKIPIVMGGIHSTIFPEDTARNENVDIVMQGAGEYSCLKLSQELSKREEPDFTKISGITFRKDGKLINSSPREFFDINTLPFINYDLLDVKKYIHRSLGYGDNLKRRSLVLHTGTGCPFRCAFCANVALHQRRYTGKTAARILAEMDFFIKKYNIEYVSFCDELFFVNKKRIQEFLDGLEKRGYKIQWYANIRADCFKPDFLSEDLIEKMKRLGCHRLGMGVESGSQRILDEVIKKDIRLEYVLEAARLCSEYDIGVGFSFMMGLPGEKKEDTISTVSLMDKIKRLHRKCFFFGPQIYIPFPGSELYKQAVKLGFSEPQDLEGWAKVESNKNLKSKLSGEYLWSSFDPSLLPWLRLKHIKLIRHIDFMQNFLFRDLRTVEFDFKYPIKVILIIIGRIRVRFSLWRFPAEYWLFCFLSSFMTKGNKTGKNART